MIDVGIREKLKKLRDKFVGEHPDALSQINAWENRAEELSRIQEFRENLVAQEIYKKLKDGVKDQMRYRIQPGRTNEAMTVSDAQEKTLRWVLDMFNPGYEQELETLEKIIDAEA